MSFQILLASEWIGMLNKPSDGSLVQLQEADTGISKASGTLKGMIRR